MAVSRFWQNWHWKWHSMTNSNHFGFVFGWTFGLDELFSTLLKNSFFSWTCCENACVTLASKIHTNVFAPISLHMIMKQKKRISLWLQNKDHVLRRLSNEFLSEKLKFNFCFMFWNHVGGCLLDQVDGQNLSCLRAARVSFTEWPLSSQKSSSITSLTLMLGFQVAAVKSPVS